MEEVHRQPLALDGECLGLAGLLPLEAALFQNGTLYLYFDVGQAKGGTNFTNVWEASHQGLLTM